MIGIRYQHRQSGIVWEVLPKNKIKCVVAANGAKMDGSAWAVNDILHNDYNWPSSEWLVIEPKEDNFNKLYDRLKADSTTSKKL